MTKTVFIIGAGASHDFDMPLGNELVDRIRDTLAADCRNELNDGILRHAQMSDGMTSYTAAAREVAAGMIGARSIDRFLESRKDRNHIVFLGKCAIAHQILKAERGSKLSNRAKDRWENAYQALTTSTTTWLHETYKILAEGINPRDAASAFEDTAFITFNYDRCIERYFQLAFEHIMNLPRDEAYAVAANVPVVHVYGSLGELPGVSRRGIGFGDDDNHTLEATNNIRTFTEGVEDRTRESVSAHLADADRVICLGFAFDPMNVRALFPGPLKRTASVYGTTYMLVDAELSLFKEMALNNSIRHDFLQTQCLPYCQRAEYRALLRGDL